MYQPCYIQILYDYQINLHGCVLSVDFSGNLRGKENNGRWELNSNAAHLRDQMIASERRPFSPLDSPFFGATTIMANRRSPSPFEDANPYFP
jgi:hypothetical protein